MQSSKFKIPRPSERRYSTESLFLYAEVHSILSGPFPIAPTQIYQWTNKIWRNNQSINQSVWRITKKTAKCDVCTEIPKKSMQIVAQNSTNL